MFSRALDVLSRRAASPVRAPVNRMGKSENDPLESQTDLDSRGCRLRRLWRDSGGTAAALECFGAPIRVRCVLWPEGRVGGLQGAASFLDHLWVVSDSSGEHAPDLHGFTRIRAPTMATATITPHHGRLCGKKLGGSGSLPCGIPPERKNAGHGRADRKNATYSEGEHPKIPIGC